MKKLITIILILFAQQAFCQERLTNQQTVDLMMKTNNLFCETLDVIIRCMFEFDETKFSNALTDLKTVIKNYELIETSGTFTNADLMAKQRCQKNKWSALSLFFDKEEFKNGERNKKVTYAGIDRKIPKKLKKQFDKLNEISNFVCICNMM